MPKQIQDNSQDLVTLIHVLEHCLDPKRALENVFRITKPGGLAIIETPNHEALTFSVSKNCWPWLDVPRHLNFFTEKSLKDIAEQAGFEILDVEYMGFTRQFQKMWRGMECEISRCFGIDVSENRLLIRNCWLLFRLLFSSKMRKYDSVRVVAKKPSIVSQGSIPESE